MENGDAVSIAGRVKSLGKLVLREAPRRVKNAWVERRHDSRVDPTCVLAKGAEVMESSLARMSAVAYHGSVRRSNVGRYSSIGRYTKVADADIGSFCSISWDCTIGAHGHPFDTATSHQFPFLWAFRDPSRTDWKYTWRANTRRVTLGSDVWIGANAVVRDGVRVGHGAVIGSGAVVTKDVAPYMVVGGVPAREIRARFPDGYRQRLLEIRWWDWSEDTLRVRADLFRRPLTEEVLELLAEAAASELRSLAGSGDAHDRGGSE